MTATIDVITVSDVEKLLKKQGFESVRIEDAVAFKKGAVILTLPAVEEEVRPAYLQAIGKQLDDFGAMQLDAFRLWIETHKSTKPATEKRLARLGMRPRRPSPRR
jgi:predicted RNA binding protein YcfA (HicA-like mRNA interferase family)